MARRERRYGEGLWLAAVFLSGLGSGLAAVAQKAPVVPATDSSVQASPIDAPAKGPDVDGSVQASPEVGPVLRGGGQGFAPRTALPVTLTQAIDSGKLTNGQRLAARLSAAVGKLPAGTPVSLSVIASVPAGKLNAAGEFSLELVSVGSVAVYTETQTFRGQPGPKDLPDSAPTMGTDAGLPSGAPLTFHVQAPPAAAVGAPKPGADSPGGVTGRASGSPPPAGASAGSGKASGNVSGGQQPQTVNPGNTTTQPVHSGAGAASSTQPK